MAQSLPRVPSDFSLTFNSVSQACSLFGSLQISEAMRCREKHSLPWSQALSTWGSAISHCEGAASELG
jgi:hypothetical protein